MPPVAVYGWVSLGLWLLAFVTFFIPEAVAVLVLARRHPGEGGIYLWTRKEFGDAHGFLSGWCYWTNNLFYVPCCSSTWRASSRSPVAKRAPQTLVNQKLFVAAVSFGWLALIAVANIRGLAVGKWIQNIGGLGAFLSVGLVLVAAPRPRRPAAASAPMRRRDRLSWEMATSFAVMCNALVGIELASTMGDEIRDPKRDLGRRSRLPAPSRSDRICWSPARCCRWCRSIELGVIQGIMQAVGAGATPRASAGSSCRSRS